VLARLPPDCILAQLSRSPTGRFKTVRHRALAVENKWRAQRYGIKASFIERGFKAARTMRETVDDLLDRLHADAQALDCVREISHARAILARGSSAHQQVHVYSQARIAGRSRAKALKDVVDFLLRTTVQLDSAEEKEG
jgi:glutamate---cysteine ligase / carboxylate-amine ligase